ncbi:hypothetical protein LguiA_001133 [Lonicera macranthoides]
MLQVASKARRLARVLPPPPILLHTELVLQSSSNVELSQSSTMCRINHRTLTSQSLFSGVTDENLVQLALNNVQNNKQYYMCSMRMPRASFCSEASTIDSGPTEAVKELYGKMLKSVIDQRTAPPNAWLWSLIEKCANHEDINLLFDILQNLRRFRLSNLRIHENFNCNLCREVTKACARVGAIDFGKKALWKHNLYGLTPSVASAHSLLLYAKQKNDAKLMVEIMKLLKKNDLRLQPGTADIVFSICYNTGNWDLISKYSKWFVKAGAKLRQTSFDVWMDFAAKIGDTDSLWKIEKLRSESMKKHTLATAFSCAKGFLLEQKPENAAAIIQDLDQTLSIAKRLDITAELQKLVLEWPLEVLKHRKEEDKKALTAALHNDILAMVHALLELGVKLDNMEDLIAKESLF